MNIHVQDYKEELFMVSGDITALARAMPWPVPSGSEPIVISAVASMAVTRTDGA